MNVIRLGVLWNAVQLAPGVGLCVAFERTARCAPLLLPPCLAHAHRSQAS
jgi:hypothetical protein